jgi:hypothetical protein
MAKNPSVSDPDKVPEIFCDGRLNFHAHGNLGTLTFTHLRSDAGDLFNGTIRKQEIVRARITMSLDNMAALRDLLVRLIQSPEKPFDDTKH